jgi:hypothetical protein
MSRSGIEPLSPPRWEASNPAKLVNSYSEHLHTSARPVDNACDSTLRTAGNEDCTFYSIGLRQETTTVCSEFLVCLERGKGARGSSWSCGAAQSAASGRSPRPLSGRRPPPPVLSSQGGKATVWSAEWKEAARRV